MTISAHEKIKSQILPRVAVSLFYTGIDTEYAIIATDRKTGRQRETRAIGQYAALEAYEKAVKRGRV